MTTDNQAPAEFIVPSSPADIQKIKDAVGEAIVALDLIEAQKDQMKSIEARMKDELGIPTKLFKEWVKTHYTRTLELKRLKFELFDETYTKIFGEPDSE